MTICIVTIHRSNPEVKATKTNPLVITIFHINIPRDIPTGRDPRGPHIDQAPDLPIELMIAQDIPIPTEFPENETKTRPIEPNLYPSRSPHLTTSCSHNLQIGVTRELHISQLIPGSPDQSPVQER